MKPPIDHAIRTEALDPTLSAIVSAPAGSGKTYLLTRRILNLMMTVSKPNQVFAITFTKKAAHEMRERLLGCLESNQEAIAKLVNQKDQELNWGIKQRPEQISIMTIDAFCAWLLKHANANQMLPISSSPYTLYQQSVFQYYHQQQSWSPHQIDLLAAFHGQYNQLEQLLASLLGCRDQWQHAFSNTDADTLKNSSLNGITQIIDTHLQETRDSLSPIQTEIDAMLEHHAAIAQCMDEEPHQLDNIHTYLLTLANLLLTQSGSIRKSFNKRQGIYPKTVIASHPEAKQHQDQFKALISRITDYLNEETKALDKLQLMRILPSEQLPTEQAFLKTLTLVLKDLLKTLQTTFQKHQTQDFTEISQRALSALQTDRQLQTYCQHHIQHILIDEFQDTSASQYQLLESLIKQWGEARGHTLFAVGDPMQSIYRFRQADVGLFIKMQHEPIAHIQAKPLSLACNFRSSSQLIDQINQLFHHIFPKENQPSVSAIRYSHATPTQASKLGDGIYCHLESDPGLQPQAQRIVQLIQDLQQQYPGQSIAVLTQARSHLQAIIPALEANNIAFNALDIYPSVNLSAINDLSALLSAIIDPYDRLSWMIVLRSPLCGLSLNGLYLFKDNPHMLKSILSTPVDTLHPDDQSYFENFQYALSYAKKTNCLDPIQQVWHIWNTLSGFDSYPQEQRPAIEKWFTAVTNLWQENYPLNRTSILTHFRQSYTSKHIPNTQVYLLTTHKSKGLEYDHVIIPHLEKKKPPASTPLFFMEGSDSPIIQPSFTKNDNNINYFKHMGKLRDHYESLRLLYVACTRAKSTLHLLGHIGEKVQAPTGSWLASIQPYFEVIKNIQITHHQSLPPQTSIKQNKKLYRINRQIDKKDMPQPVESVNFSATHQDHGIALHAYMQYYHLPNREPLWQYFLHSQGLIDNDQKQLIEQTRQLSNILDKSVHAKWILSPHTWSHNEYVLTCYQEDILNTYIIDRLFLSGEDIWIIDYKFPQKDKSAASLKHDYEEQLTNYILALKQHYPKFNIKSALYLPLEDRLIQFT